jgi:hypothetical protein
VNIQPKTPLQHAQIQFIESMIITALMAAIASISPLLTSSSPINWRIAGASFALAFLFSAAHSLSAYLKASRTPLGEVIETAVETVEKQLPASVPGSEDTQQMKAIPKSAPLQGSGGTGTIEGQSV